MLGQIVDLGNTLPAYRFRVMEPDGKLVGVMRGLIYEGYLLAYDPTSNLAGWVPVCGTANDLSVTEDASACKLSNITLLEEIPGMPRMEHFVEHWDKHTSSAVPVADAPASLVEVSQLGAMVEASQLGATAEEEAMLIGSLETSAAPEMEVMEVEPLGWMDDCTQPISWESWVRELGELMGVPAGSPQFAGAELRVIPLERGQQWSCPSRRLRTRPQVWQMLLLVDVMGHGTCKKKGDSHSNDC